MQWIGPLEVFNPGRPDPTDPYSYPSGVAVQIPGLEDAGPVVVKSLLPPMTRARLEAFLGHPYLAQALLKTSKAAFSPMWTNFDVIRRGLELGRFPPDCSFEILSCKKLPERAFDGRVGVLIRPTRAAPCPRFGPGPLEPLTSPRGLTIVPGLRLRLVAMCRGYGAMTFEALEALLARLGWEPAEATVRNLKFMRKHRHSEFAGCLFELHAAPELTSVDAENAYVIWPVRGPEAPAAAAGAGAGGPAAGAGGPAAGSNRRERTYDIPRARHQVLAIFPYTQFDEGPVPEAPPGIEHPPAAARGRRALVLAGRRIFCRGRAPASKVAPAPRPPEPVDPPSREQALGDRFLEVAAAGDLEGLAAVAPEFLATPRPGRLIYYYSREDVRCYRLMLGGAETHAQAVGQALRLALYAGHEAAAEFLLRLPVELRPAELSAALAAAAGLGQTGLVKTLLEDPRTPGDPETARGAFEDAALSGRIEAARLLVGRAGLAKWAVWDKSSFIDELEMGAVPSELLDLARGVAWGAGA